MWRRRSWEWRITFRTGPWTADLGPPALSLQLSGFTLSTQKISPQRHGGAQTWISDLSVRYCLPDFLNVIKLEPSGSTFMFETIPVADYNLKLDIGLEHVTECSPVPALEVRVWALRSEV